MSPHHAPSDRAVDRRRTIHGRSARAPTAATAALIAGAIAGAIQIGQQAALATPPEVDR